MPRFAALGGHLHQGKRAITGEGGGPLGSLYDPFRLDYDPIEGVKLPQLALPDGDTVVDCRRAATCASRSTKWLAASTAGHKWSGSISSGSRPIRC